MPTPTLSEKNSQKNIQNSFEEPDIDDEEGPNPLVAFDDDSLNVNVLPVPSPTPSPTKKPPITQQPVSRLAYSVPNSSHTESVPNIPVKSDNRLRVSARSEPAQTNVSGKEQIRTTNPRADDHSARGSKVMTDSTQSSKRVPTTVVQTASSGSGTNRMSSSGAGVGKGAGDVKSPRGGLEEAEVAGDEEDPYEQLPDATGDDNWDFIPKGDYEDESSSNAFFSSLGPGTYPSATKPTATQSTLPKSDPPRKVEQEGVVPEGEQSVGRGRAGRRGGRSVRGGSRVRSRGRNPRAGRPGRGRAVSTANGNANPHNDELI